MLLRNFFIFHLLLLNVLHLQMYMRKLILVVLCFIALFLFSF